MQKKMHIDCILLSWTDFNSTLDFYGELFTCSFYWKNLHNRKKQLKRFLLGRAIYWLLSLRKKVLYSIRLHFKFCQICWEKSVLRKLILDIYFRCTFVWIETEQELLEQDTSVCKVGACFPVYRSWNAIQ